MNIYYQMEMEFYLNIKKYEEMKKQTNEIITKNVTGEKQIFFNYALLITDFIRKYKEVRNLRSIYVSGLLTQHII